MHNITFNLTDLQHHGAAFWDYLRLRKTFFVDTLHWDIPHNDEFEMDQYDNPLAYYSLVVRNGKVIGGSRVMPTTSKWGQYTYMLRDAVAGRLSDIPQQVLSDEIESTGTWECTRLVISDDVSSQVERSQCLSLIVDGLIDVAAANGASELMSLSPLPLMRALRQLGYPASRLGEPYASEEDGRRYAVLRMPAIRASHMIAAE